MLGNDCYNVDRVVNFVESFSMCCCFFFNCQVTILSLLIARDISRHLRVHAAFGQASLWSFAEIAVVAARCVAANSIARARTKCFGLAGQKNVGIGSIPSDIIGSGNCQMVEV